VKSELDHLIEYYELERDNLQSELDKSLGEKDFLMADAQQSALWQVERQLRILYTLKDPLYDEKDHLRRLKDSMGKMRSSYPEIVTQVFFTDKIKEIEQKIERLAQTKIHSKLDGQELDDLLFDLAENKISGFKLNIHRKTNLYLEFTRDSMDQLTISFTPLDLAGDTYIFDNSEPALRKLGFSLNEDRGRFEYTYDLTSFRNSIFLKTLIAIIIYDMLGQENVDKETIVEIFRAN